MSHKTNRARQPEHLPTSSRRDKALSNNTDGLMRLTKVAAVASAGLIAATPHLRHEVAGFVRDAAGSVTLPGTPHEKNPSAEQLQAEAQQSKQFTVEADPNDPSHRIVRYHTSPGYTTEGGIIETIAPGQDRVLAEQAFEVGNPSELPPNSEVSLVLGKNGDILPEKAPPEEPSSQATG